MKSVESRQRPSMERKIIYFKLNFLQTKDRLKQVIPVVSQESSISWYHTKDIFNTFSKLKTIKDKYKTKNC